MGTGDSASGCVGFAMEPHGSDSFAGSDARGCSGVWGCQPGFPLIPAGTEPASGAGGSSREPEPGPAQHRAAEAAGGGAGCLQEEAPGLPGGSAAPGPAGAEAPSQGKSFLGEHWDNLGTAPISVIPLSLPKVLQYKKKCGEMEQQLLEKATELEHERLTVREAFGGPLPRIPKLE